MQEAPVVHFMCDSKMRVRFLTHFYAFLFFESWEQDLFTKRFVRDHLRYADEIQCAAARVVAAIRDRARRRDPTGNSNGDFDSFHIRKLSIQKCMVEADQIYENSKDELQENATVFVATDHKEKPFFKALADHYDLVFLSDFKEELKDVNTNYFGMIDQLVASRGRVFFGCTLQLFRVSSFVCEDITRRRIRWRAGIAASFLNPITIRARKRNRCINLTRLCNFLITHVSFQSAGEI
ncbi:GDP-fucose protein O-fucosyltransferase family protein [Skeletonema marinoi]|uniref:GDP-fucose protein O-fucosyltransferase family protein n=1 Tax=Skeletonema marinoi TaxID=267567 RepID=A0AAD8YJZ2_9STRA|nr:GDP-fucose protein O-fucosyltransferase family protein [Skeletonema marinoi]